MDFPQHANGVFRTEVKPKAVQKFTEAASCSWVSLVGKHRCIYLTLSRGGSPVPEGPGGWGGSPAGPRACGGRAGPASPSLLQHLPGPVPRARGRQVPGRCSFDEQADEM